ncbi:TAL effector repeat-containing protein [Mycetohabitans endofungorum]|uniref:TAL effector repeat-containing protein n=1 Tax=Mycetohabitans endofungorum TaxID=417203 RepID=UPI003BAF8BA9
MINLSPFERLKIEKHSGGADALAFISNKYDALTQVLSRADILKIADHDYAAHALQAVLDYEQVFRQRGFARVDIIKITGNDSGAQALKAVIVHGPTLNERGHSGADIVKITGNAAVLGRSRRLSCTGQRFASEATAGPILQRLLITTVVPRRSKRCSNMDQRSCKQDVRTRTLWIWLRAQARPARYERWLYSCRGGNRCSGQPTLKARDNPICVSVASSPSVREERKAAI